MPPGSADCFVVEAERDVLNARIGQRFDRMLELGGWDEARRMEPDWDPDRQSSRAIGARELIEAIRGGMAEAEAIEAAKLATRQYAKRQRTWMRSKMAAWSAVASKN